MTQRKLLCLFFKVRGIIVSLYTDENIQRERDKLMMQEI